MKSPWIVATTLAAALGSGLMAGLLFAFSAFVMSALGRIPAAQGIRAMQSINLMIVTPIFLLVFIGAAAGSLVLGAAAIGARDGAPERWWLLAGSALYLVGVIGVTAAFNIPRNNALAALDPEDAAAADFWARYLVTWTAWNHVRAAAALGATASFIAAFRSLPR